MAIKLTDDNHYKNIANAIRTKTGTENKYKPGEMAAAIRGITTGSTAYGTLTIRTNTPENETVDVANFASVIVDVPASAVVSGNKEITSNGSNIDVESYRTVSVNVVPDPPTREMTLNINEDHVDVRDVGFVNVRVPASVADTLGDKPIDSNGTHTVIGYSTVTVDVPSGGSPSGTINLNHNGTFNVSNVAQAIVDVKASSVTMGTTDPIYANGIVNVEEYKYANVQVRPENVDVGSTTISTNGEHNVVGYASVMVTVPTGAVPTGAKNITENEHEKNKLYHYIYNHSNININQNNDNKNKSSIPKKNLALSKKTYKNSASKLQKSRKISFVNAISENLKLHYKNKMNNYEIKNDFNYNIKSIKNNKEKKDIYIKPYKKRKNRSQESKGKTGAEYLNEIGQFQSVEEIHFIFVQMNQKKKAFFENKSNESINN